MGLLQEPENAAHTFQGTIGLFQSVNDTYGRAVALYNWAVVTLELNKPNERDSAINSMREALGLLDEIGSIEAEAVRSHLAKLDQ